MNLELLKHAKNYIEKMANGINPLTGETVKDDDLINNIKISRCLFYVNGILGEVISNGGITNTKTKTKKTPFKINEETLSKYPYSEEPIPISKIVEKINNLNQNDNMYKLRATTVSEWLSSIGLLEETQINGRNFRIPTEKGKEMGMYLENRIGYSGEYVITMYPRKMQEFIIDNFDFILDFINKISK